VLPALPDFLPLTAARPDARRPTIRRQTGLNGRVERVESGRAGRHDSRPARPGVAIDFLGVASILCSLLLLLASLPQAGGMPVCLSCYPRVVVFLCQNQTVTEAAYYNWQHQSFEPIFMASWLYVPH